MKLARELRACRDNRVVHISLQYMGASTPYAACSNPGDGAAAVVWVSRHAHPGPPTCLLCIAHWEKTWAKNERPA